MRKHVVLVPGFAGFDALGGLRYYAGVTEEFRLAQGSKEGRLDYFDNFPTATVKQRAERLRLFLAKKYIRGDLKPGDELTLIGHSTGGLDIRQLLRDLRFGDDEKPLATFVDGCSEPVAAAQLRALIHRIVFMSVPHFGTNIGDFFNLLQAPLRAAAASAARGIERNTALPAFLSTIGAWAASANRCELFHAIADMLRETDEHSPLVKRANEREARYELLLWLDHVHHDVGALSDLRSFDASDKDNLASPAFYGPDERAKELDELLAPARMLGAPKVALPAIDVLSFATRVRTPPAVGRLAKLEHVTALAAARLASIGAPPARLLSYALPFSNVASDAVGGLASATALARFGAAPESLFWHLHAMCGEASLPFSRPPGIAPKGTCLRVPGPRFPPFKTRDISTDQNDGIVNTLSMLWPYDTRRSTPYTHHLVEADHADIIGHYEERAEPRRTEGGRHFAAYDLFQSGSGFGQSEFKTVWQLAFKFALI